MGSGSKCIRAFIFDDLARAKQFSIFHICSHSLDIFIQLFLNWQGIIFKSVFLIKLICLRLTFTSKPGLYCALNTSIMTNWADNWWKCCSSFQIPTHLHNTHRETLTDLHDSVWLHNTSVSALCYKYSSLIMTSIQRTEAQIIGTHL